MRIAVGGLHTECSTYNPVLMREEDFTIWRGGEMLEKSYFDVLKRHQATYMPTFYARAVPGGPVAGETYRRFKAEFLAALEAALPLDGIYLAMHGAVFVEGMEDVEGDWLNATRALVGPDCLIAVSYDLHGNLSQRIIDAIDIFSTYRTAPHIDVDETQARSLDMLFRALETGVRPIIAWAPIPVVLPGERTSTEDEPAKSLYARLPEIDGSEAIWDASLQVGYVWADEPRTTAAAVMTGTDADALKQAGRRTGASLLGCARRFRLRRRNRHAHGACCPRHCQRNPAGGSGRIRRQPDRRRRRRPCRGADRVAGAGRR